MDELSAQRMADALRTDAVRKRQQAVAAAEEADRLEDEARRWAQGAEGERATAAALAGLDGAVVLHDLLLDPARSQENLDHVVVAPAGVYLVDSKAWSGQVSVYEHNLWQHLGPSDDRRHRPRHEQLDHISRAAATVERVLDGPVSPVLCLTAAHHSPFPVQRVRGVDVVPVGSIAGWLRSQPPMLTPAQVELSARRVRGAFPRATGPALSTVTRSVSPRPPVLSRPPRRRARATASRPASARHLRPSRGARRMLRLALAGAAVWLLLSQLPALVLGAGRLVSGYLASTVSNSAPAVASPSSNPPLAALTLLDGTKAPARPCEGVSTEQVSAAVGRTVVPHSIPSHDTCGWHLEPQTNPYVPPDIDIATGYVAQVTVRTRQLTGVTATAATGTATVLVPQFTADPAWNVPASAVTQPFRVSYRYAYPAKPSPATITATDAAALNVVTTLARDLATHLPQGPGADDTSPRL